VEATLAGQDVIAAQKQAAARAAVNEIQPDMLVGIGTGTSARLALAALAERAAAGLKVTCVATSRQISRAARTAGLTVRAFDALARVDLAIDGADEIDPRLRAIKGHGGALLREKVVAQAAGRMIVVADARKLVATLGEHAVPVEVLPFAAAFVASRIETLGARTERRMADGRSFRTDQGNIILDCRFDTINDPGELARILSDIPGMLGHGLFLDEIDAAYVGTRDGVTIMHRPAT
jgi:ribose 5-phosphate isomerase A